LLVCIRLCIGACFSVDSKVIAASEGIVCNAGDAVGDNDAGQTGTKLEGKVMNTGDAVGDDDIG